ncbi:PorT family protein [Spirosoma sp. 209]|uniref:PorT family protein n=1 Tax=Spirosoma sp. 209 TaxID=1955701 RepID=UPI0011175681|nr:PorT family protein [Spirosoma sp. 209]
MILSIRLLHQTVSLIALCLLSSINVQAQSARTNSIDSLIARENLQSSVRSYYIRPLLEFQQGNTEVQGDAKFTEPRTSLMRKVSLGIRVGYRSERLEVETGLSSIRVGTGYQFTPEYGYGLNSRVRSTDYTQVPLTIRYRFWQPAQRFSLRAGIGIAYNFDANRLPLSASSFQDEYSYTVDGSPTLAGRISSNYIRKTKFWSGEINLSAYYQLSRRFNATVEAKRLISSNAIATFDNVREVYNPASTQRFNSTGGIYRYNVNLGVSYQFGFQNRYRYSDN